MNFMLPRFSIISAAADINVEKKLSMVIPLNAISVIPFDLSCHPSYFEKILIDVIFPGLIWKADLQEGQLFKFFLKINFSPCFLLCSDVCCRSLSAANGQRPRTKKLIQLSLLLLFLLLFLLFTFWFNSSFK